MFFLLLSMTKMIRRLQWLMRYSEIHFHFNVLWNRVLSCPACIPLTFILMYRVMLYLKFHTRIITTYVFANNSLSARNMIYVVLRRSGT